VRLRGGGLRCSGRELPQNLLLVRPQLGDLVPNLLLTGRELRCEQIDTLPYCCQTERKLLQLYYYEDRPLEEAGKILGLSKSWSSRLHARAVELLKDELEKRAVTPERTDRSHKPRARR